MSIFKYPISSNVVNQINARQNALSKRTSKGLTYFNSRTAWVKMTSAVDVKGDKGTLAKKNILLGGALYDGNLRAGVGIDISNAYSLKSSSGATQRLGIRPMPGITGIDVKTKSAYGSLMEATVNFVCWDIRQLEDLELLYMRPNYSVLLEWGWIPYLTDENSLSSTIEFTTEVENGSADKETIWQNIHTRSSKTGNYCAIYGFVKNYSWSARPDGGYDCTTSLITMGEIIESLKVNYVNVGTKAADEGQLGWKTYSPDDFKKDGVVNKSYQKGYLAGLIHEIFLLGRKSVIKDKTAGPVNLGGTSYSLFRFDVTATGGDTGTEKKDSDKDNFVDDPENIYIRLKDFIEIFNKYVTLQNSGPGNSAQKPLAELSVMTGLHQTPSGKEDLLCLGNIYQISMNPMICLIKNEVYNEIKEIGIKDDEGKLKTIQEVIKALPENYFYKGDYKNKQYGIIGNIYVNTKHIYDLLVDDGLASQDKKEKKDISLFDFFKLLMGNINTAIGNVANFDIHIDPTDSVTRIVDINYVDETDKKDVYDKLLANPIEVQGLKSTARSYKLESQIFPEQSAIVAIGAQVKGGAQGSGDNTLIDFNQNLIDRIIPAKDISDLVTGKPANPTEKNDNLKTSLEAILEYAAALGGEGDGGGFLSIFSGGNAEFDATKASSYAAALKDIITEYKSNIPKDNNNNRAIIPTKLSITLDGIGGLIIGNLFTIPLELLPRGYKGNGGIGAKIVYLVTKLGHSIDNNNDWTTTIDAQFIIMDESTSATGLSAEAALKATSRKIERAVRANREEQKESSPTPPLVTESKETEKKKAAKKQKNDPCPGGKTYKFDVKSNPGIIPAIPSWETIKKTFPIIPASKGVPVQAVGGALYGESGKEYAYLINYPGIRPRNNKTVKYIVIHYTAGAGRKVDPLAPYIGTWAVPRQTKKGSTFHACADFNIGWTGRIAGIKSYKKYYSNHYGGVTWGGIANMNSQSIGIEIENVGYCYYCGSNKKFYKNSGQIIEANEVAFVDPAYRDISLWERHPDVQISALANLLIALYNDGILADNAQFLTNAPNMNIVFPASPLKKDPGCALISHGTGSDTGKVDTFPQSNLIEMLKQLPALIKANPNLKFSWQGK